MILPGKSRELEGRIGTTWDQEIIIYPATYSYIEWNTKNEPEWNSAKEYILHNGVLGYDGSAYGALKTNININPVGDVSGNWEKLIPQNIAGYSGEFKCGNLTLKNGEGITLEGSKGIAKIKAKYSQTNTFEAKPYHFSFTLLDTEENLYEYVEGQIKWKAQ